jgi:hypothetical protein
MGPPDNLSLPADHSSAFQFENFVPDNHIYLSMGAQWLQRQHLGAGATAVLDPATAPPAVFAPFLEQLRINLIRDYEGFLLAARNSATPLAAIQIVQTQIKPELINFFNGVVSRIDARTASSPFFASGASPPKGAPVIQQFNNLDPRMDIGVRGTLGYMFENCALEYTGYYIFENNKAIDTLFAKRVDTFFFNVPPGFEGNRNLFLQADRLNTSFQSSFWNNEVNLRRWNSGLTGCDLIVGVRYLEQRESLNMFVDADVNKTVQASAEAITANLTIPASTLALAANYAVFTKNRILAPQFGFEYACPVCPWVSLGLYAKGAWGANFLETEVSLIRSDGYVGFDTHRSATVFSQVYDTGVFADFHFLERLRVRAGYNMVWLLGIAAAPDQVDFNLQGGNFPQPQFTVSSVGRSAIQSAVTSFINQQVQGIFLKAAFAEQVRQAPHGNVNNHGSTFWQGPQVEIEFLF